MKYFDYTSTTPVNSSVLETYIKTTNNFFANTTSLHKLGQMSNILFEKANSEIKTILQIPKSNIIYTSNATEANNLAIFGITEKYQNGRIITTKIEHPSVYEVFKKLETKFEIIYLDIDQNGQISLEQLKRALNNQTILVSIMWVNNIIGAIQPLKEIISLVKQFPKTKLHVDAVQGLCKINADFDFDKIDLWTFSPHKIYGPKGIGCLIYKNDLLLEKRLYGSTSQYSIKPGTVDLSLAVCVAKTLKIYYPLVSENWLNVKEKFLYLYRELEKIGCLFNTVKNTENPYILNIYLTNIKGEVLVHALEQEEIYISTGSACSSKLKKPEKTIYALTNDMERAMNSVRISLSPLTTREEINSLIAAIVKTKETLCTI